MKLLILALALTLVVGALCEEKCVPGTTFMEDCNRCRCSSDGLKACTRKMCPPNELSDDAQVRTDSAQAPGSDPALSSGADEKDEVHLQTNGQVCTPNEIKMQECNRCRCANNGIGWFCTRRACPPREKRATGVQECIPGTNFKSEDGCNSCFCTDDGRAACTLRACLPKDAVVSQMYSRKRREAANKCTPNSTFLSEDGCNTCFCDDRGNAACTLMACLPAAEPTKEQVKRETAGEQLPQSEVAPGAPGFSCTPRSSFKYQCNTCLCSEDGKNAGCTFKFCIPGEW